MKLTITMRDSVVERETDKKFREPIQKAEIAYKKSIEELVKKSIPNIPRDLILDGWIQQTDNVYVRGLLDRHGNPADRCQSVEIYNMYPVRIHSNGLEVDATPEIVELQKSLRKLEEEKKEFRSKMNKVMYAFNTVKQLLLSVPELESHFKTEIQVQTMAVIPIDAINELRGMLAPLEQAVE